MVRDCILLQPRTGVLRHTEVGRSYRLLVVAAICCAAVIPLEAQYGGTSIPMPSWGHKKSQKKTDTTVSQPSFSADGQVVSVNGKTLVIATEDGRQITLAISPETKFTRKGSAIQASSLAPLASVHVNAGEDDNANLTATSVDLLKDPPVEEERAEASSGGNGGSQAAGETAEQDAVRPTIMNNPVAVPNRPVLKRGVPKHASSADDDEATETAPAHPASTATEAANHDRASGDFSITDDSDAPRPAKSVSGAPDLVARSKEWAQTYMRNLPNYVCQQFTTRYVQQSKSAGWQPQDIVTAKVIFEDGKEQYKDITVGGKKTSKSIMEVGGATSSGEFATTLHSLMAERSSAQFKLYHSITKGSGTLTIYDFKVALRNSDWTIQVGGQSLRPAYSGSVWIDKETAQVRRIEMQADSIPQDFPFDSVEWAVDYDNVALGTTKFLLPIHAENLACQRGSSVCSKNTIDFRDYHKYSGESTITFQ